MPKITSYKRGWVSEAPKGALEAALADTNAEVSANAMPRFEWQQDGHWRVVLQATDDTKTFADVTLDMSQDCLRVTFPGQSPHLLDWPAGTGAAEMDACSARFSKRRGELMITLPSAQNEEVSVDLPAPCEPELPPSKPSVKNVETVAREVLPSNPPVVGEVTATGEDALTGALRKARASVEHWHGPVEGAPPICDPALQMAGTWMLHSAATTGDVKKLEQLLGAGVNANAPDESGVSALEKACIGNHPEAVAVLLARGAKVNGISTSTSTPLHRAAVASRTSGRRIVQMLCDHGANRTAKDGSGRTPSDLARAMGLETLPELL